MVSVWQHLAADVEQSIIAHLSDSVASQLLSELDPSHSASLLNRLDPEPRERYVSLLDPEIGLSVIDLDLIREVVFTAEEADVRMVLTTPFCPYGPMLINQIQTAAETAAEMPVKVTVLPDRWEPPPWLR